MCKMGHFDPNRMQGLISLYSASPTDHCTVTLHNIQSHTEPPEPPE